MKKAGLETSTLAILIVVALTISILFIIIKSQTDILSSSSNSEAINVWIKSRQASGQIKDLTVPDKPPVKDLEDPLEIKSEEQLEWLDGKPPVIYREIANSMVNCWNTFDKGDTNFLSNYQRETFCFPCRSLVFPENIVKSKKYLENFYKYLVEEKINPLKEITYYQYLINNPNYKQKPIEGYLKIDSTMYIMFVESTTSRTHTTINRNAGVVFVGPEDANKICNQELSVIDYYGGIFV